MNEMAITKRTEQSKIEVVKPFNHIQVRTDTIVEEDGVEIGRTGSRHVVEPTITSEQLAKESADVQALVKQFHTQEIKDAYAAHLASMSYDTD